jgi:hypothetical protein
VFQSTATAREDPPAGVDPTEGRQQRGQCHPEPGRPHADDHELGQVERAEKDTCNEDRPQRQQSLKRKARQPGETKQTVLDARCRQGRRQTGGLFLPNSRLRSWVESAHPGEGPEH